MCNIFKVEWLNNGPDGTLLHTVKVTIVILSSYSFNISVCYWTLNWTLNKFSIELKKDLSEFSEWAT